MRRITLTEWVPKRDVELSLGQTRALRRAVRSLSISPSTTGRDRYDLTAGAEVGVVRVPGVELAIRPKIGIDRLLFLISFALDPDAWRDRHVAFEKADSLVEAVIPGFLHQVDRALRPGVLQGYRRTEETGPTIRGRIRFSDQIRRQFGRSYPVEVEYDDFTVDIELNRLLKAAIYRLGTLPLRKRRHRERLHHFWAALMSVTLREYNAGGLPDFRFSRLNERYRPAIQLARLILQSTSIEFEKGRLASSSFLMDMNTVFEDFVVVSLREELGLSKKALPQGARGRSLFLDLGQQVVLEPDISWWENGSCIFVGDVKYKRADAKGARNPDLYQLLSYAVGSDLPAGLLIYAEGEMPRTRFRLPGIRRTLDVTTLDPSGTPDEILGRVAHVAARVRTIAEEGRTWRGVVNGP